DVAYIRDEKRAEIVNEALDMFRRAERDAVVTEARNANPELFSNTDPMGEALERQRADEPYVPDFTIIPDALAKYAEADESAEDFRRRAFNLLFRFGIAEGENFEGGGEPLT